MTPAVPTVSPSARRGRAALRLAAASLALLALAGCERVGGLAPFTNMMGGGAPESAAGAITVQKGDNAYMLSRRHNVPLRDLIEVNRLSPPYKLEVGQRLTLPAARQYIVQKGDTLYGISRMHNVDVSELTTLNNLTAPYAVQAGQPLRLPGAGDRPSSGPVVLADAGTAPAAAPGAAPGAAPSAVEGAPRAGRGSIQAAELPAPGAAPSAPSSSGITASPLPAAKPGNGVSSTSGEADVTYQPGQAPVSLRPPGSKPVAEPLPAAEAAPATIAASPLPPSIPAGRNAAPAPAQASTEVAAAPPRPEPKTEAAPPPRGAARFLWPVKGKLISGYGPKPDGLHNDGLNIAAGKGTAVIAADNGVVAYAGNELRGFGNLLLLKHADGWITAYAHLDRIDVERGATVKRGQTVGRVGQTGAVSSPQLHFELRKGSQAVDPTDQMDRRPIEGAFRDGPPGPG